MNDEYNESWSHLKAFWYARGYYDGRTNGVNNKENIIAELHYFYDLGYRDSCVWDIKLKPETKWD